MPDSTGPLASTEATFLASAPNDAREESLRMREVLVTWGICSEGVARSKELASQALRATRAESCWQLRLTASGRSPELQTFAY